MNKNNFLSETGVIIRYMPLILVVIVDILCLVLRNTGLLVLISIFGGLLAIGQAIIATQMNRNINMLKQDRLYEKMIDETPENLAEKGYAVTQTFVFGYKRRLCIPITQIIEIYPGVIHCINNTVKDKAWLEIKTTDGTKYDLLYYNGFVNEKKISIVRNCAQELIIKNPLIKLKTTKR